MQRKRKCRFGKRTTKKGGWESEGYEEFRERKYKEQPDKQRMIKRRIQGIHRDTKTDVYE